MDDDKHDLQRSELILPPPALKRNTLRVVRRCMTSQLRGHTADLPAFGTKRLCLYYVFFIIIILYATHQALALNFIRSCSPNHSISDGYT